ncbi:MAG TPA: hypothetical protein VMU76_12660 [Acidimicrobiales bacterium]|nr:hypothetical protein [Acidimicrobiales bacterium]
MGPRAELSALHTSLDELLRRVTALAEQARAEDDENLASELFTVERSLNGALRRLRRAAQSGA